jgi:protein O-mannosyl-transferase
MVRRKSSSTKRDAGLLIERADSRWVRFQVSAICAILVLATFFVYWPVRHHDFINFDDGDYVTCNPHVQSGLTWQTVRWAFTSGHAGNWHPATWLSHALDCQLFGLSPYGPHVVNLLFHVASTLLLFLVLRRMTGAVWPSVFVAAAFGLHPLRVESVAWVSERKDVLSTFFWMLTLLAYAGYAQKPKLAGYGLVLLLFVLGLLAKPMLVTLPFVLLLLDYWPLERMQLGGASRGNGSPDAGVRGTIPPVSFRYILLEKVPFVALALASSFVTFLVHRDAGAMGLMESISLKDRLGNAVVAYVGYVGKMFWPSRLAVVYPHPGHTLSNGRILLCGLLLVAASAGLLIMARRRRYLAVGWLWYLGTLVPVIGLVQVGVQAMADRYTYIPTIGLLILIAWGVADLLPQRRLRLALIVPAVAVICALAVATSVQLRYWRDSVTLFEHALAVTSRNATAHETYGLALMQSGRVAEAADQFRRCIEIGSSVPEPYANLGNACSLLGRTDEALEQYRKALSLDPNSAPAHYNIALALSRQNKTDEAIKEYEEALRLAPDRVNVLFNLGAELDRQDHLDRAIELYRRALATKANRKPVAVEPYEKEDALEPNDVVMHERLGGACARAGKTDEALVEFQIVLKARPNSADAWRNLGPLLERQGRISEAIEHYRHALQINPDDARAQRLLRAALAKGK